MWMWHGEMCFQAGMSEGQAWFLSFFLLPVTEALVMIQDGVNQELGQLNLNLNYLKIVAQFKIQEVGNRNREEKKITSSRNQEAVQGCDSVRVSAYKAQCQSFRLQSPVTHGHLVYIPSLINFPDSLVTFLINLIWKPTMSQIFSNLSCIISTVSILQFHSFWIYNLTLDQTWW